MENNEVRLAHYAGSWYSANESELDKQLVSWLESSKFDIKNVKTTKAIIAPHAGYLYSGSTAAWSYKYMRFTPSSQEKPLRIFLLGPCHHVYIRGCGLTNCKSFATPIGDIEIDTETVEKLKSEGKWIMIDKETEEHEHSLEMHLPYIKKMFSDRPFKLVPIMVGSIDALLEKQYGEILAKYFDQDDTVFCVSSDFCHWGKNFRFSYYNKEDGEIYQSIEKLDKVGMKLIEEHNTKGFSDYLTKTKNTICGRHPISVLLNIIAHSKDKDRLYTKFVRYTQSDQIKDPNESSVSYAAAVTYLND